MERDEYDALVARMSPTKRTIIELCRTKGTFCQPDFYRSGSGGHGPTKELCSLRLLGLMRQIGVRKSAKNKDSMHYVLVEPVNVEAAAALAAAELADEDKKKAKGRAARGKRAIVQLPKKGSPEYQKVHRAHEAAQSSLSRLTSLLDPGWWDEADDLMKVTIMDDLDDLLDAVLNDFLPMVGESERKQTLRERIEKAMATANDPNAPHPERDSARHLASKMRKRLLTA